MQAAETLQFDPLSREGHRAAEISLILEIVGLTSAAAGIRECFARLVEVIHTRTRGISSASLLSWDPDGGVLDPIAVAGERFAGQDPQGPRAPLGGAARALATGRPWIASDLQGGSEQDLSARGIRSALCVPILSGDRALGLLCLESRLPGRFGATESALFEVICEHIGATLRRFGLHEEIERKGEQIRGMTAICHSVLAAGSLDESLQGAVRALVDSYGYYCALVALVAEDGRHLVLRAHHAKTDISLPEGYRQAIDRGIVGRAALERRTVCVNDTSFEPAYVALVPDVKSELCVPLVAGEKLVGVLDINSRVTGAFDPGQVGLMETLGGLLALAIDKAGHLEETRRTRDYLENLIAGAGAGIFALDAAGRVARWNQGMEKILGYRDAEVIAKTALDLETAEIFPGADALIGRAMRGESLESIEVQCRGKDGARIDAVISMSPIVDPSGAIEGVSAIVRDVTEKRRLERSVSDATREKEALQLQLLHSEKLSALGQLISGVAHELNNPLTGVIGYSQLLSESDCEERIRRGIEKVYAEARRCHRVVQNLLTFARKHAPQKQYVSINEILSSTLELRSYQLRVDDITVVTDFSMDLPRTMGDYHQLQQVFLNIINNAHHAMQATGKGGTLTVRSAVEYGRIRVDFSDTGHGIPPENLKRIFDPFFTTKQPGQGTGLGLSICFGIVEEHEGRILVTSSPGEGSLFTVDLPVLHREEPEPNRE